MGKTYSKQVHHHHHYYENPETVKKLQQVTRKFQIMCKELQELKNPKKIEIAERKLFLNFLEQLVTFDVYNKIPKEGGVRYAAIIGENSAGKSSLYNTFLGCNEQVGIDDTTQNISKVKVDKKRNIVYFDSPGLNEQVNITNADTLKAFYEVDIVFIVTAVTFKNSKRCIEVMNHINPPKLILLRNQCDKFQNETEFENAKRKDYQLLQEWGIKREILYISAHKDLNYRDNNRFNRILQGQE